MLHFHVHYTLYNYKYLGKKGFPQPEVSTTLTKSQLVLQCMFTSTVLSIFCQLKLWLSKDSFQALPFIWDRVAIEERAKLESQSTEVHAKSKQTRVRLYIG